nr:MAG: hypothetical protein [Bacteriophage sp.]
MDKPVKVIGIGYEISTMTPEDVQAQPVGKLMYTPLETVFRDTLAREGKTVTAYTSNKEFQAFFRKNNDENNIEDRIFLFYDTLAPVDQGNLIKSGRKTYLILNRETEENSCYYRSSAIACNGMITLNDHTIEGIPCYAASVKNANGTTGQVITMINGNMEFLTEDNLKSRKLDINNTFNEFGRTWQIKNLYYKDGMAHILAEVTGKEVPKENLDIKIEGVKLYVHVGDAAKYSATAYLNQSIAETATIEWKSSNEEVATIDREGTVLFKSPGTVYFTAKWIEKNFAVNTEQVTIEEMESTNSITITGSEKIPIGSNRTYILKYFKNGVEESGTWKYEVLSKYIEFITHNISANKVKISISPDLEKIGGQITLNVTEMTSGLTKSKIMTISSLF